jgi:hypothetical protein
MRQNSSLNQVQFIAELYEGRPSGLSAEEAATLLRELGLDGGDRTATGEAVESAFVANVPG